MEERKECEMMANHNQSFHVVKFLPSSKERRRRKEEAEKQYHLINLSRLRINEEINQQRAEEHQINQKIMWFSYIDERIKSTMQEIKNLEHWGLGKVEPCLPIKQVPGTTGFLKFSEKDVQTPIKPDRKRCQKRLITKGEIDIKYLHLVQEELLSSKKSDGITSCGTQELNDLMKSMTQRIQHGNKKRGNEMKIYNEIRNLRETRDLYTAPEASSKRRWYPRERTSKRDINCKRSTQCRINILIEDIEKLKRDQTGREGRVRRYKAELEYVRKKIKCLSKDLENVNSKRLEAYKRAYDPDWRTKERV